MIVPALVGFAIIVAALLFAEVRDRFK